MTFTTFVMFDMFNALCCRSADKMVPQMDMFANKAFIYSVGGSLVGQVRVAVFSGVSVQVWQLCSKCRTCTLHLHPVHTAQGGCEPAFCICCSCVASLCATHVGLNADASRIHGSVLMGRCLRFFGDLMQMLVVYLPWLQSVFQTEALSLNDLAFIVFVTSSMVALDTSRKLLFPDRQGETSVSASSFFPPHGSTCTTMIPHLCNRGVSFLDSTAKK